MVARGQRESRRLLSIGLMLKVVVKQQGIVDPHHRAIRGTEMKRIFTVARNLDVSSPLRRAGSELEEVSAQLAASGLSARPDLVFGCYRVPDHHEGGALSRRRR